MSTKADRIRWLAELSAERRAERARLLRFSADSSVEFVRVCAEVRVTRNRPGGRARRNMLAALVNVQGNTCYLCHRQMGSGAARPTLDHVRPWSQTGLTRGNAAAACYTCNADKANKQPTFAQLEKLAWINEQLAAEDHIRIDAQAAERKRIPLTQSDQGLSPIG